MVLQPGMALPWRNDGPCRRFVKLNSVQLEMLFAEETKQRERERGTRVSACLRRLHSKEGRVFPATNIGYSKAVSRKRTRRRVQQHQRLRQDSPASCGRCSPTGHRWRRETCRSASGRSLLQEPASSETNCKIKFAASPCASGETSWSQDSREGCSRRSPVWPPLVSSGRHPEDTVLPLCRRWSFPLETPGADEGSGDMSACGPYASCAGQFSSCRTDGTAVPFQDAGSCCIRT